MALEFTRVLYISIATGASVAAPDYSGSKEVVMVTRNTHNIGVILAFCLLALAAMYWSYVVKTQQGPGTSVIVEQLKEPAWAVEVQQIPPDQATPTQASPEIVVATAQ
jgi:uncharacterized iron-regulated membrane protein